jgi:hypothetical protein
VAADVVRIWLELVVRQNAARHPLARAPTLKLISGDLLRCQAEGCSLVGA